MSTFRFGQRRRGSKTLAGVAVTALVFVALFMFQSNANANVPRINLDNPDPVALKAELEYALMEFGSFELVGPSVEALAPFANSALGSAKTLFHLPIEDLERASHIGADGAPTFNGFHNFREESRRYGGKVQNQLVYFLRPYLEPRVPKGANIDALNGYYYQGVDVLQRLYKVIADNFITDPARVSRFDKDTFSGLTARKYLEAGDEVFLPHSDFPLLTLVMSDEPGLEILQRNGKWLPAQTEAGTHFFVNVGDWLRFQTGNPNFPPGVHRVSTVTKERHSLAVFLNPSPFEKSETKDGRVETFLEYMQNETKKKFTEAPTERK